MEAMILAGGFGTRLRHIVSDVPKPMAQVRSRPFMEHILNYLDRFNIGHAIIAVGYKSDCIIDYFGESYKNIKITYSVETTPLGTGGAIKKALALCREPDIFILNGDTLYKVNLDEMLSFHLANHSPLTLAVKPMIDFNRYGSVTVRNDKIVRFNEKKPMAAGLINGGVYLLKKSVPLLTDQQSFSFEKEILEGGKTDLYAFLSDGYFIDIGVPDDYDRAQNEMDEI